MLPLAYPDLPLVPRLVAVATASSARAERARRELGDLAVTTSFERLLDDPRVALVDCCAPTGDHARMTTATLLAGRALFCEKPLTASLEDSEQIVALAQARSLIGGINSCGTFFMIGLSLAGYVQHLVCLFFLAREKKTHNKGKAPCCRRQKQGERKSYYL
jgi:Oxidoreductase family, NAD-binding Rossmann fold